MAGIINPNSPQFRYIHKPLASAQPIVTQITTSDGAAIIVAGGVTIRQQLAATMLSGRVVLGSQSPEETVAEALKLADELIRQTADDWKT